MKKLIFAFTLMFGVILTSCGNSTKSSTTNEDSIDTAYVNTFNVDTTLMDSSTQVNPQLGKAHLNIIRTLR